MSLLTTTANAMALFLESYLKASKEDKKLSPKDFAFLSIKGALPTENKLSAVEEDSDENTIEEAVEQKETVIVILNSAKTPKPRHGVIAPDHLMPKLLKVLEGLADQKKVARKYPGADFDQGSLPQVLKCLKKHFEVEQVEYSEFEGPSWIKPKTKPATKGKPGPKPGQKKSTVKKAKEVIEVDDDEVDEAPKGKKATPKSSKKSKKVIEVEDDEEVEVEDDEADEAVETPKGKSGKGKRSKKEEVEDDDGF
jgi:hypothetical protein